MAMLNAHDLHRWVDPLGLDGELIGGRRGLANILRAWLDEPIAALLTFRSFGDA